MENKFNFKPFDKVLIRDNGTNKWIPQLFSYYYGMEEYPYGVISGMQYKHCVPYEGNEHLAGTTDDYVEPYVPHDGDFVVSGWEIDGIQCEWIAVVSSVSKEGFYYAYFSMFTKKAIPDDPDCSFGNRCGCVAGGYTRSATEEEKQLLLSKLKETGKKWNAKKKCIEDVWQPKDGDFIYIDEDGYGMHCVAIFRLKDDFGQIHTYADGVNLAEKYHFIESCKVRPATDSEKQQLLDALHKDGKDWDAEKKEIVDMWTPKDGDFVYVSTHMSPKGYIYIHKNNRKLTSYWANYDVQEGWTSIDGACCKNDEIKELRPATEEEKQLLLDALHKKGKNWDESKKEIVENWPEMYNTYAFVTGCGDIRFAIYQNTPDDQMRVKIGNCFPDKEEAQPYADKFKELLKGEGYA